jgi:hypothetical protein
MPASSTTPPAQSETDDRPVEAIDYAALNAAYGSLLVTLVLAARQRGRHDVEPITGGELLPLGLATFALAKLVVHEKVESWVRQPFVARTAEGERHPRGHGLRYAVGELLTCTRCVGGWSALAMVGLRVTSPPASRVVTGVLCASAINDFAQAGFRWLCNRA